MKVAVFGLGYVGTVMMGCLARAGHRVTGVDRKPEKVELLAAGVTPVVEPGLDALVADGVARGALTATADVAEALDGAAVSFVCVGTPPAADGRLDTAAVEAVCAQIGDELRRAQRGDHTVVVRSTVMPGTTERCSRILADRTGRPEGAGGPAICVNPELLREGSAVADFLAPPFTVVGASDPAAAEPLREVYGFTDAPFVVTEPRAAEALKLVCNAWHALKVGFANEVGRLGLASGVDPLALMELFVRDERLNLSASYLRPGFAYGGSCLPKDVGALVHLARASQVELPLVESLPRTNGLQVEWAKGRILASGCRRVGFLGLSFKPDTDDLRGSPLVDLVEFCVGKGLEVRVHDRSVEPARLLGENREVALERLGHLAGLLAGGLEQLAARSELVVVGHRDPSYVPFCRSLPADRLVLDLVGLLRGERLAARLDGLTG